MIPEKYKKFKEEFPEIISAYDALGDKIHEIGPLDEKTRRLIRLAYSISINTEGNVHSQTRKALEAGCSKEEIIQVLLLGLLSNDLSKTVAAYYWILDIING